MNARFRPAALVLTPLLALAATGCAPRQQRSASDQATIAACREAADRVYAKQNRGELYESDRFDSTGRDAPYAVAGLPDVPSRGLSGAYQRDTMEGDCLNASGLPDGAAGGAGAAGVGTGSAGPAEPAPPPGQP